MYAKNNKNAPVHKTGAFLCVKLKIVAKIIK